MRQIICSVLILLTVKVDAQITIHGSVNDNQNGKALAYINIGIPGKNTGTISSDDGSFSLVLPADTEHDTLVASMVGYKETKIPLASLHDVKEINIKLNPLNIGLDEFTIKAEPPHEVYYGLKNYHPLLHFIDGSINTNDIFEIAQLVKLGKNTARIKSISLHVNESLNDSAVFRINFYRYNGQRPAERVVEKNITQKLPVHEGWLNFNLLPYNLHLKGDIVMAIEFIPNSKNKHIVYEVKPGGRIKSFTRANSQGAWQVPPHQYRMYVTALQLSKNELMPDDERDATPAFSIHSSYVTDSFFIFLRLPHNYEKSKKSKYPVIYVLDANVYFNYLSDSIKKMDGPQPILVGIGYRDFAELDSLRDRDYTFPIAQPADSFRISGGAEHFYQFITKELMPRVNTDYRTDNNKTALLGHSLGGYFTLYALYRELTLNQSNFSSFTAASPSIHYHDGYIVNQFKKLGMKKPLYKRSVFITYGSDENDEPEIHTPELVDGLLNDLKNKCDTVKKQIYQGAQHMETALPSFYTGMQTILE